jgi:hypothetical protein
MAQQPNPKFRWEIIFVPITILLVFAVSGIGTWKWLHSRSKAATPPPVAVGGSNAKLSTLPPLVIGEKAVTADAARAPLQQWLEKAYQVNGLTPEPALLKKDQWQPFARAVVWEECGDPQRVSQLELHSMARDLAPVAKEHPVSAYLVGMTLAGEPGSKQLLEKAVKGFSENAGNETLAYHASVGLALASSMEDKEEVVKQYAEAALVALRKALDSEGGYAKHHDRVIAYVLMSGHLGQFFSVAHEQVAAEVMRTPSVKPWVRKWIEGQHCLQWAWNARGGGDASSVSHDEAAVFRHQSEKARRLLEDAWALYPEDPSPAVAMIYSGLSLENSEAPAHMRKWFEEVLQLQVDVPEASHNLLWGLRPRWFGSHQKMYEVGFACVDTGRFDSHLPWTLLQVYRDCASEWDVPSAFFKEMDVHSCDSMRMVFNGAEAEAKRAPWRSVDRTQAAVFEFKCGHNAEAQKWLDKLDSKPNSAVLEEWGDVDAELLLGKTAAFVKGDEAGKLRRAESAEQAFKADTACTLYRETLDAARDKVSEVGRKYLESRTAVMEIEKNLESGSPTSLMPDATFLSWTRQGGGWKRSQDALSHWGRETVSLSTCQARIGASFVAEGDIEITDPGEACQVWLSYGYPERWGRERWIALRFAYAQGKTLALLSNRLGQPLEQPEIKVQPRFRFKLAANTQGVSLYVDGVPAFENVPVPDYFVRERWGQIGLGAATKSDQTRVKVHSLTVKR